MVIGHRAILSQGASSAESSAPSVDRLREVVPEPDGKSSLFNYGHSRLKRGEHNTLLVARHQTEEKGGVEGLVFEPRLFVPLAGVTGPLTRNAFSKDAIELAYHAGMLEEFLASDSTVLPLPLTGGREALAQISEVVTRGDLTTTLRGSVVGVPESQVTMVFHDGAISGSIAYYVGGDHYQYGSSGHGAIAVRQLSAEAFTAVCGDKLLSQVEEETLGVHQSAFGAASEPAQTVAAEGVEYYLDSVIGYGATARASEGGTSAMEAKIIEAVDRTNTVFANSQISNAQYVLVGMVEDPSYTFPGTNAESMGSADELGALDNLSDGVLDTVTDLKSALGADHAAFIIDDVNGGTAGIAYRPGDVMIVARTYVNSLSLTFIHELGHNLGCRHAWGDSDYDSTGYESGWRFQSADGTEQYRTVMAYQPTSGSWDRVPYFSNLLVTYNGLNMGASDGYDASADATVDPELVSYTDETSGTTYQGYDGSNTTLGARNAEYIIANASTMAAYSNRVESAYLRVEGPSGDWLYSGTSSIDFSSSSVATTTTYDLVLSNAGGVDLTGLIFSYTGEQAAEFSNSTVSSTIGPYEELTVSVTHTPTTTGTISASLVIASNDTDNPTYTISLTGAVRSEISALSEDFDTGFGAWSSSTGYDFNWTHNTGSTPSSDTGPASDASGTGGYLFTEASFENSPQMTAAFEQSFDFTSYENVAFQFSYHMFGFSMGALYIDVYNGVWNEAVHVISGEKHFSDTDAWSTALVDLSSFVDGASDVIIRVRAVTGDNFGSDIAIDEVRLLATELVTTITSISDWYESYSLSGSDADPYYSSAGDGVTNLEKYAFNMDPTVSSRTILTPTTGTEGLPYIMVDSLLGDALSVEYIRRRNATDLLYSVYFGDEPGVDDGVSRSESVSTIDDDWERVIVQDTFTTDTKVKRFASVILTPLE